MNESKIVDQPVAIAGEIASRSGAWWRLPFLLAAVLVAIVAARSLQPHERSPASENAATPQPAESTGRTVALIIRFDAGRERKFDAIAWHPGMTVDELLTAASRLPSGITYTVSGDHEMTLLGSIDGVVNEWGGGKNWTYQVNEVPADRSFAVYEIQPGDRVLWTLGRQE
jgi:hypothetical protein